MGILRYTTSEEIKKKALKTKKKKYFKIIRKPHLKSITKYQNSKQQQQKYKTLPI